MKIIKNFFITIKTKGFIVSFLAIKNFFKILLVNFFSSSTFIKKRIFNYQMYLDPRDKGISRTLLLFGERELDHKIILEKVLRKDMKVFDIGANIGYYVLMESSILGINGRIVAVEPVPKNMHLLKKNLELNKNNITTTFEVGLSNLIEKKFFLLSEHSNLGHILDDDNTENKKKIKIQTISLNKLIKKTFSPDFIRMDIEGYEENVLKDLSELKLKKFPIICFETHLSKYKKMKSILKKLFLKGYKVKYASSSFENGSVKLKKLGYKPILQNIRTDDVKRDIYTDIKERDAIDLICNKGGLRTILMTPKN